MKKLFFVFISFLVVGALFQACSDSKTYAEMLEDERNAINDYIKLHNIKVISVEEFEKDTITRCYPAYPSENEYVLFSNGVYMQIVSRGEGDTIKNRDEVLVRFLEYDIMAGDTTYASNYNQDGRVDSFYYTEDGSSAGGKLVDSWLAYVYSTYYSSNNTTVPAGWLVPIRYIKDMARVKLIVPSKMGHTYASQQVYPYFYDMRRYQIR